MIKQKSSLASTLATILVVLVVLLVAGYLVAQLF